MEWLQKKIDEVKAERLPWKTRSLSVNAEDLQTVLDIVYAARRFVPDPKTIQLERREIDLRQAFQSLDEIQKQKEIDQ